MCDFTHARLCQLGEWCAFGRVVRFLLLQFKFLTRAKGWSREKGNNTGIIGPSRKARFTLCLELCMKQICIYL